MKRLNDIRNIGIIAHVDAGKTTVTERILYYSGHTYKLGSVDDGNTVMDTDPQESKRGITIQSAAITTKWTYPHELGKRIRESQDYNINIIDTPGHVDFTAEVERSLRILDGAVAVFCAKSGVEPQSETVWRQADKHGVPRIAFINKMDRQGADFGRVVSEIKDRLGARPLVIQIPVGSADDFEGLVDIVSMQFLRWNAEDSGMTWSTSRIPIKWQEEAEKARNMLMEQVAIADDELLESYLENREIDEKQLIKAIRHMTIQEKFLPVMCGAAFRNMGVQPVLDAVVRYLPTPEDRGSIEAIHPESEEKMELNPSEEESFSALVFKVISDPYVGKMTLVRVYSGQVKSGVNLFDVNTNKKERLSRIFRVLSNKYEPMERAEAGGIYAFVGIKSAKTGDTLCTTDFPVLLQAIDFPQPVIGYAIEARDNMESQSLGIALSKLQDEDPTLTVLTDPDSGQTILRGMGELHLEVILTKLKDQHHVDVIKGEPQVAFKETLTKTIEMRHVFKKQNSGSGQFADISFEIGPRSDDGLGLEFVDDIKGGVIPKEFIPSVQKGFESCMTTGGLGGFPLESMRIRLFDGKIHSVDSHALDFEIAAMEGYKLAYAMCQPRLLEPIMTVSVQTPKESLGSITGDLNRREGIIQQIEPRENLVLVEAELPLRNLFGYITDLRGMSGGRASASMTFSRYTKVQNKVSETILVAD